MSQARFLLITLLCSLLQACASPVAQTDAVDPLPHFGDGSRFGTRPDILTPDDLHRLTPEQAADFLAYYHDPAFAGIDPHWRLYRYLEQEISSFTYSGDTLTASEAFASRSGNCLSLAIFTTAVAQLAGIEVGYQLLDDQPVFEYQGNVVRKGVHVRSIVYNPAWVSAPEADKVLFTSMGIRIDYFPALMGRFIANIDAAEYLALYYSNIASDAITALDYNTAYWHLLEALRHAPYHGPALNMLAVVNRRTGDIATAEQIYRYGIAHSTEKLSMLKNYHTLLTGEGRVAEARQIQLQLDAMNDPSPFHWLQLARESHDAGDWGGAIRYYQRALSVAPYLHEAHLGMALSYYAAGRLHNAEQALLDATVSANRVSTRNLYEAKLAALRNEL